MFPQHVISRGGDISWPARLPDLSGYVYFWWGYLNSSVVISKPTIIEELKQRVKEEISAIPEQMTRRLMENRRGRLEQCLRNDGGGGGGGQFAKRKLHVLSSSVIMAVT
jgi:hypothetical protein